MTGTERRLEPSRPRIHVVLVGEWHAVTGRDPAPGAGGPLRVERCPVDPRRLKELVAIGHPEWLLVGPDIDEATTRALVVAGQSTRPAPLLAMLGTADDTRRCQRWVRRGCCVYLEGSAGIERMAAALDTARALRLVVVDRVVLDVLRARQVQPCSNLTRREDEVLQLMCEGLRNVDIANRLHVTEHTVEYHVTRLLAKLGARNRVEAVDRATGLGLA